MTLPRAPYRLRAIGHGLCRIPSVASLMYLGLCGSPVFAVSIDGAASALPPAGPYVVFGLNEPEADRGQTEILRGLIRNALRTARIDYVLNSRGGYAVTVQLTDPAQRDTGKKILANVADPPGTRVSVGSPQYDLTDDGNGAYSLRMTQAYRSSLLRVMAIQQAQFLRGTIEKNNLQGVTVTQNDPLHILIAGPTDALSILTRKFTLRADVNFRLVDRMGNISEALAGNVPSNDELLWETDEAGQNTVPYLVERDVMVSGARVAGAVVGMDSRTKEPAVFFKFDELGTTEFATATTANVSNQFVIVLDGKVIFAAVIGGPILGGAGEISGRLTMEKAIELAARIMSAMVVPDLVVTEDHSAGP